MTRLSYWAGRGLAAAVCIGAVAWVVPAFLSLMNQVNGFQKMTVPGAKRTIAIGGMCWGMSCRTSPGPLRCSWQRRERGAG